MPLDRRIRALLTLSAICVAASVQAAPFCTEVTGIPSECIYVDAKECSVRATQLGGRCVANPAELKVPAGAGRFCLVDSNRSVLCAYPDYDSCQDEAQRRGEVCLDTLVQGVQKDIYQTQPGRRY